MFSYSEYVRVRSSIRIFCGGVTITTQSTVAQIRVHNNLRTGHWI